MPDGQGVAGQVPLGAGPDASAAVEGGDRDTGQPLVAVGADDGVPGEERHAVAQQPGGVSGALGELACQGRAMAGEAPRAGGLDERGDLHTGCREPGRHGQQQRPGPGHDGSAPRHHQSALEHGLGAPGGDDAREGPAGEGQHLLVAAGGQEHGTGVHLGRFLLLRPEQHVHDEAAGPALHTPHMMIRQHPYRAGGESVAQPLPGPPPVVQRFGPPGPEPGGGLPVELPARLRGPVDERDPRAPRGRREGRGETGRSGPDHDQVSPHGAPPHGPSPPVCR
ncbi:hypothetical protein GCM10011428_26660 [Streptomyces violaceus]